MKKFVTRFVAILLLSMMLLQVDEPGSAQRTLQPLVLTDPHLESGFPVQAFNTGGTFQGGPDNNILVGNFDADLELEIALSAYATGPLYAWNADSSLIPGWPPPDFYGVAYPSGGNLAGSDSKIEIIASTFYERLVAYNPDGTHMPGWPVIIGRGSAPALADVNNDGYDEIFLNLNDRNLYGFYPDGTLLPNFPLTGFPNQELAKPSIADLDQDGDLEIVVVSGNENCVMFAFHHTGEPLAGFPVSITNGCLVNKHTVIGDVDADGELEILLVRPGTNLMLNIFSASGVLENAYPLVGSALYGVPIALADLDGDDVPEIIVSPSTAINVLRADGSAYPGWPVLNPECCSPTTHPVIGDVNGDQLPEIVAVGGSGPYVWAYSREGVLLPQFPKLGGGFGCHGVSPVPAIADIDLDGRNEIIVAGGIYEGCTIFTDYVTVYDLGSGPHGEIEWAMMGGGPEHRGVYPMPQVPSPVIAPPEEGAIYLPLITKVSAAPINGMHGRVNFNGTGEPNVPLELRFYNGTAWSTIRNTMTSADGSYAFQDVPGLMAGQSFYVRTVLDAPGHLYSWSSRSIYTYRAGANVGISQFDLADLPLVSPENGATVPFPVTFEWEQRSPALTDRYSVLLYDPLDGNPAVLLTPYPATNGVILYTLPVGFNYGTQYAWTTWIISPEGATGIPTDARLITFAAPVSTYNPDDSAANQIWLFGWDELIDPPCELYSFLLQCRE